MQTSSDDSSDEEVFFGIPTKAEWEINSAVKGYPSTLFKKDSSPGDSKIPQTAKAYAICNKSNKEKGEQCEASITDDSADVFDIDKISDGISLLCKESSVSEGSNMYENRSMQNQEASEKAVFQMPSLAPGVGGIGNSVKYSDFRGVSVSTDIQGASVGLASDYLQVDVEEEGSKILQSVSPAINLSADQFSNTELLHSYSHEKMDDIEHSTVKKLLKNWRIDEMKKQKLKSKFCGGTKESISSLSYGDIPKNVEYSGPEEMDCIIGTPEPSLFKHQSIENILQFDQAMSEGLNSKENINVNVKSPLGFPENRKNVLDCDYKSENSMRNNPLSRRENVKYSGYPTTPPYSPVKLKPHSAPLKSKKMAYNTGCHSPEFRKPIPTFRSRIPRKLPISATKGTWDIISPVAQYIEGNPPPPLIKVIKCKENSGVIKEEARKGYEASREKIKHFPDDSGHLPVLPPAKYCAAKTQSSPHLRTPTGCEVFKAYKTCCQIETRTPCVTRHIGASRVVPGHNYLAHEESVVEPCEEEEKFSHTTTGMASTEMEQSMMEHGGIAHTDTIRRHHK